VQPNPSAAPYLYAYEVSTRVNSPENDNLGLIERAETGTWSGYWAARSELHSNE
jgi:hypothetical protein